MERVAVDVEGLHLGIANLDALLVGARVERTLDLQASLGRGRRNQLDDGQSVRQRSATPALRDMAEQAVLDLVPLRSTRRIVMDVDHKLRRIGELLQLDFPQPHRAPFEPPQSAVIVSSLACGYRSRPIPSSQRRIEATANSAVSLVIPTLTQPALAVTSYTP